MLGAVVAGIGFVAAWSLRRRLPKRLPAAWLCGLLVTVGSLLLSAVLALTAGFPVPTIQDEFSYLLAGDTFAHGRLTNSAHPMGRYFQTFHVLTTPTYASKYPPGQGMILAIGQWMGDPILGVWLTTAGLVGAVVWMLAAVVELRWAVAAGVAVAVHPQVIEWSRTFWGGTAAAVGGVLFLGGVWRGRSIIVGIAAGILLLTRPYEGAAVVVVTMVVLGLKRIQSPVQAGSEGTPEDPARLPSEPGLRKYPQTRLGRSGTGLFVALAAFTPFVLFVAYDNYRVTGSFFQLPYLLYERQYAAAPPLLVSTARPVPANIPAEIRDYAAEVELPHFQSQRSAAGFARAVWDKSDYLVRTVGRFDGWVGYWPVILLIGLIDRRMWKPAAVVAGVVVATLLSNWTRSQYVAPAFGAVVIFVVLTLRRLRIGPAILAGLIAGWLATSVQTVVTSPPRSQRDVMEAQIADQPGRHLVLVRYLPGHRVDDAWIYNKADIDGSKVIWARDLGPAENRPLLDYYRDRSVWSVRVDAEKAVWGKE